MPFSIIAEFVDERNSFFFDMNVLEQKNKCHGVSVDLAAVVIVYTLFGGLYSVAYTDVIQLGFIFVGLWVAVPFAMQHKGVGSITTSWPEWRGEIDKSKLVEWTDSMLLLIFGGIPWQVSDHIKCRFDS